MQKMFKIGESVIVNGIGKKEDKIYTNRSGKIIDKDKYYKDYNVEFSKKENDWFDKKYLRKIRSYVERKKII